MSDEVADVLVHIGFAKTATTTLQDVVFPRVGTVIGHLDPEYVRVAGLLTSAPDSDYSPDEVRRVLEQRGAGANHPVISDEVLGGSVWQDPSTPERTAARLHEVLPNARVLICVRNQETALASIYSLFVKKGGYVAFSRFVEDRVPSNRVHLDHLCWDQLVSTYQRRFGSDRVEVVPYELLVTDPRAFLQQIAAMVDPEVEGLAVDELEIRNRSLSPGWQRALRSTNRLFRRTHYNPNPPFPVDRAWQFRGFVDRFDQRLPLGTRGRLTRAARRRLAEVLPRFEASNARLEACTGLDLRRYGYPLPPPAG